MEPQRSRRSLNHRRNLVYSFWALLLLIVVGTLGYQLIEGWTGLDALYMTITTLATVGFGEVNPLSPKGRLFTILLILAGLILIGYVIKTATEALAEGYFQETLRDRRLRHLLNRLHNHYIICGFGRTGQEIAREFNAEALPFVVLDNDEAAIDTAIAAGFQAFVGDATLDEVLIKAGIERARCLVAAMPSDADNLYAILSAKTLNPELRTIARASSAEAVQKLRRGGADAVVSPYITGGRRMAAAARRPQAIDFIDDLTSASERSVYIDEFLLEQPRSRFLGRTLRDADLRGRSGALILAIRRTDGTLIAGPTGETYLELGDLLLCLGTRQQLQALEQLLA
ncbi:potassium channel family protein [Synechococcus elongatus]|uniref:Potassium channel protein n=1 Tax=Synechococcus elongatus PCC 11802 TaxID=2283154 RepID=A0AAT9JZP3_SYNEL|nr:potassium channel protein [Synechococcus elongatus]QFZ93150.1 potassium channel protein [Synechococcus elongatus PCC 11802]